MARSTVVIGFMVLWLIIPSSPASLATHPNCRGKRSSGKECKACLVNQLKFACPKCVPLLQCMAQCLWNGAGKTKCGKKCDRNGGKPSFWKCKACLSRCKCSCLGLK